MIAIIGCGTLGSRTAHLLRKEELLLIDHDMVREVNLEKQLFSPEDVGTPKAEALANELNQQAKTLFLDELTIPLLAEAEVIIDCTDNLLTRRLLSKYCREQGIPLIHGAASKNRGIVGYLTKNPCLECIYNNKISLENCRGSDINEEVADTIAEEQARLATKKDENPELLLVYPEKKETITISNYACEENNHEKTNPEFYLTYCTRTKCLSAKKTKPKKTKPKAGIEEGIPYEILENEEIHFKKEADIDLLRRIAKKIYSETN